MITVFFDGKCGLCSKEILHYAKLAHPNTFTWQDVANEPNHIEVLGVSQEAALRRLHARDVDGKWHIGVAAFILIWLQLPQYRWTVLAKLLKLPLAYQISQFLYGKFADYRFSRLAHCKVTADVNSVV